MTDSFWRNPPWAGGKGGYRMGLRPIASVAWLPERIDDAERRRKRSLLSQTSSGVFAALEGSHPGQQQILDAVVGAVGDDPDLCGSLPSPLQHAALLVPDDLCLMERAVDSYRLTAACVCSPSYWRLADKIGRSLDGIHEPVPTLNAKLATSMRQFFDRLPRDSIFERRNWLMHTSGELYHPTSEPWRPITIVDAPSLIVRSERQTLRRLDETRIVFTIRVTCRPLGEIVSYPDAARDLSTALQSLDDAERSAKGFDHFAPAVLECLRKSVGPMLGQTP